MKVDSEVRSISIFPLNLVLFPGSDLPLHIFEDKYKKMFSDLLESGEDFGVVRKQGHGDLANIGCTARIVQVQESKKGRLNVITRGVERFELLEVVQSNPYIRARIKQLPDARSSRKDKRISEELKTVLDDMIRLSAKVTGQNVEVSEVWPDNPLELSYLVPATFYGSPEAQQLLLEMDSTYERLENELTLMEEARRHLAAQSALKDAVG